MHKHKKFIVGVCSFVAIVLCAKVDGLQSLLIESAVAQGGAPTSNIFTQTANLAVIAATAMEVGAFIIFHFLQFFLDPLFILDLVGSEGLRKIWKYSRDIMNVIFAFMLIFSGIYTVVTGKKEFVNEKYKKFILAVILVNFSWFFPRVILDVANVLTATIYQLPAGLNGGRIECRLPPKNPGEIPLIPGDLCTVITDIKYFKGCNPPLPGFITLGVICFKRGPWVEDTNTAFGILNGLVANYGKLGELLRVINPDAIPAAGGTRTERYKQYLLFLMHIMFIMVLMAMLFLPLAAMFVVFLIRIPILWVTIAFMPFMFLGFVIGDKMKNFDSMKIFEHFVKAAFLPAVIAVPFAAGFIILTEISQIPCPAIAGTLCKNTGPLLTNVNTLWGIFMLLIAFFIIWFGFWAALSIDSIYTNATAGIKNFGSSIGKTALKLPLSVPIPIGGGQKMSLLGLDDAINRINASLSRGEGPGKAIASGLPGGGIDNKLVNSMNDPNSTSNKALDKILVQLKADKTRKIAAGNGPLNDTEIKVKLQTALTEAKADGTVKNSTTMAQWKAALEQSSLANDFKKLKQP